MSLTQEEINKIHEEESERAKARSQYSQQNPTTVKVKQKTSCATWGCLTLIVLVIVPAMIGGIYSGTKSASPDNHARIAAEKTAEEEHALQTLTELGRVEVLSTYIEMDSIGTPNLLVKLKNNAGQAVDAVTIETHFFNNYDQPIGKWNSYSAEAFHGIIQERIESGATYTANFNLAVYDQATKVEATAVVKVHYVDGSSYAL